MRPRHKMRICFCNCRLNVSSIDLLSCAHVPPSWSVMTTARYREYSGGIPGPRTGAENPLVDPARASGNAGAVETQKHGRRSFDGLMGYRRRGSPTVIHTAVLLRALHVLLPVPLRLPLSVADPVDAVPQGEKLMRAESRSKFRLFSDSFWYSPIYLFLI